MAHTDRDADRVFWRNHHRYYCPNSYRTHRIRGDWTRRNCDTCARQPHTKYWCSTDGKSEWNRDERRVERSRAKRALRECRDYDDLSIKYRRPYWD